MELKKIILLIPALILIVSVSGCTIPGMGTVCIPFLPCEKVVELEDDIIVIKSLDALPQTVSNEQQIRLVAYVQNTGKEPVPQRLGKNTKIKEENQKININLYDYCSGLFSKVEKSCDGGEFKDCKDTNDCFCKIDELLPGQIKPVVWILKAGSRSNVPLKTECDLKVSVTYPYKTTSLSTISFIDYNYMQNQINEGTFKKTDSYIVSGYGPVKPMMFVEDEQPIAVQSGHEGNTVVNLKIKNKGKGYLCRDAGTIETDKTTTSSVICDSKIPAGNINISGIENSCDSNSGGKLCYSTGTDSSCTIKELNIGTTTDKNKYVTLIKKESPPMLCEIKLSEKTNLPRVTTKHVIISVEYLYEFRQQIKIIIEPKM